MRPKGAGRTGLVDDLTLAAMFDAVADDVDVVNVSLGGSTVGDLAPPATAAALRRLRERSPGCVVVAAAGNTPLARPMWPAAFKGVVAVGALDGTAPWAESARGWWVDAWANGLNAHSTFFDWNGPMEHEDGATGHFKGGALWSGTSFVAPRVAGTIAANARPGQARQVASRLLDTSPALGGEAGVVLATMPYVS